MKITGLKDTIAWYDANATKYDENTSHMIDLDQVTDFADRVIPGGVVLDAGCGAARDTVLLAEKGLQMYGIDLSHGLISRAKEKYPQLQLEEGNLLSLPYSDSFFDGLWAHASLVHLETIEDVKKALSEFHRVLKKHAPLHVLVKAQLTDEKTAVVKDAFSDHDRFFQYYSMEELLHLLTDAGFTDIELSQYNEHQKHDQGRVEVEWLLALARKK